MEILSRSVILVFTFAVVIATSGEAQHRISGTVVAAGSGAPIPGVTVSAARSQRTATTGRFGEFVLWIAAFPETLMVGGSGWQGNTVALDSIPGGLVRVELGPSPVILPPVIVATPGTGPLPEVAAVGRWRVGSVAIHALPAAIEHDALRSLVLVPSVSFSTPLSGRPLLRGYDAGQTSFRIDGFEIVTPYHIGRAFSALTADAVSSVEVSAAPYEVAKGNALAGVVDMTGRQGPPVVEGGADVSLVSVSSWVGGGSRALRAFGATRAAYLSSLPISAVDEFPYGFQDFYGNLALIAGGESTARVTVFGSHDRIRDEQSGDGMQWANALVGLRGRRGLGDRIVSEFSTSWSQFTEGVFNGPARGTYVDVANEFRGIAADWTLVAKWPAGTATFGVAPEWRHIVNRVVPRTDTTAFPKTDVRTGQFELAGYAEWQGALGSGKIDIGLRADLAGGNTVLQPRARVQWPISQSLLLGIAIGRTTRLYHLVADPRPEPEFLFYDFWLAAGRFGIPIPRADHVTVQLGWVHGVLNGGAALFGSLAHGLVELRPLSDTGFAPDPRFRFGRGRTGGVELHLAAGVRRTSAIATYSLTWSERNWVGPWVPWSLDRRHQIRVAAAQQLGSRWRVSITVDGASGLPLTPVSAVVAVGIPDPQTGGVNRDSLLSTPTFVFGTENSARGGPTFHMDAAVTYSFAIGRVRGEIGASVVNVAFTPVAPAEPEPPAYYGPGSRQVVYRRAFSLPPIPTLTLRLQL